jgi:dTDP-glucose pyrophosphorylase
VPAGGSLQDAMKAIDLAGTEIALAVDGIGTFVGALTDGDIRRALLSGAGMDAPLAYYIKHPFTVSSSAGRAEVLDLMQARRISQVPIVDGGKLVGLHLLHEIIGPRKRPNVAVVMAGGEGLRLRPLTETTPKPMLRVAGRPILERIVLHLVSHGITRVFLSVNYLAGQIEEHFGDGSRFGCRIEYLREDRPLGTGGALSLLPPVDDPVLVMNGDLVTQADLGAMLDFHAASGRDATIGVRRYFHTVPYGVVTEAGIEEKPRHEWMVNAGIYVLDPSLLARVRGACAITSLLGESTAVFEIEDEWADVGQHSTLMEARGA